MVAQIQDTLQNLGLQAFGGAMPVIAGRWLDGDVLPQVDPAALALVSPGSNWRCPLPAALRVYGDGEQLAVTLTRPEGASMPGPGLLVTLLPQTFLRLRRLYARVLEDQVDTPIRPVPRYFFYSGTAGDTPDGDPGDDLQIADRLTIYDEHGWPIDPLAVAAALTAILARHPILQQRADPGDAFDPNHQLGLIAGLASGETHVRLSGPAGEPYAGTHLEGISQVDTAGGIFNLAAGAGLTRAAPTAADGAFPPLQAERLLFGPMTNGVLGASFSPPALPAGVSLTRDFFSLQVVELGAYLRGMPNDQFAATRLEPAPAVRLNEPLTLLSQGNDLLAAATAALAGADGETLAVAAAIRGDFATPSTPGAGSRWPAFPPLDPAVAPASPGPLPVRLRDAFNPVAVFFDDGDAATKNVDVILTLAGLPPAAALRVYTRLFDADANRARGNGAGAIVAADGTLAVRLHDPLNLRRPGMDEASVTIPTNPTLICDVVVVKRSGEARIYGALTVPVTDPPAMVDPTPSATNPFVTAGHRGICNAGIMGLGGQLFDGSLADILDPRERLIALAREFSSDQAPRDAPRLPTMARRDLLVAGQSAGTWTAVLAAGRLTPDLICADQRLGAPGSPGGRETQSVGVTTTGGRLAYDIARMALRRSDGFGGRLQQLAADAWNEPPALAVDAAGSGSFAGAVLQTIAPGCETPELALFKPLVEAQLNNLPRTFDALVDQLVAWLDSLRGSISAPGLTAIVNGILTQLVNVLNSLKDDDTLSESPLERLYTEVLRELSAAIYGRRDTQWALEGAFSTARRCIYIETSGVAPTSGATQDNPEPYTRDLFATLSARLAAAPGLHVIICVPKHPAFAPGYEPFAAREVIERRATLLAPGLPAERVVVFHPIGFPGRPSEIEGSTVIVDDVWALLGSSSLRRRGLTFDGSSDLVLADTVRENGLSPAMRDLRRELLATRLGVAAHGADAVGQPLPEPSFARLADGVDSFYCVREMLVAGGLGRIARLWNGLMPGVPAIDPATVPAPVANPEGLEFDVLGALALDVIAGLRAF